MKVGIVTTHIPPAKGYGGVSVTAGVLTKAWADLGHKVTLVSSDESIEGPLNPSQVRLGRTVKVKLYRCYGFKRWGFGLGAIPLIFRLCVKAPVIYIHGIATWPSTLAALFCAILRRPFMVAVHGGLMPAHVKLIQQKKPHKWLFYKLLTFPTLRRAIAVHCTSPTEVEGVRNVLGNDSRILLVPNGIDSRSVEVAQRPVAKGMNLCFLGHIQQEKGINAFIRAWLQVRGPFDCLAIAGRSVDGLYFQEFQSLVERVEGAIAYYGYLDRDGVNALLASSHYLVLPSGLEPSGGMRENFGNVVAEAMAAGRPVLVARGLAWDHLASLGAGFVFDTQRDAVRDALLMARRTLNRAAWHEMSDNARRYTENHLDSVKLGERIWTILSKHDQPDLQKWLAKESVYD